jgi:L-asparaginase
MSGQFKRSRDLHIILVSDRLATAKTIVLTGAMIPYAIQGSDALFNLGFACAVAQLAPHGVYIAMNGQIFAWDNVHKNTQTGVFEVGG